MKMKPILLIGILLALFLLPTVSGLSVSCEEFAKYSVKSNSWTLKCYVNSSEPHLYYTTTVGLRNSHAFIPVDGHNIRVTIYQEDITNFSEGVLFNGALAGIKVPVKILIYMLNTSSGNF